MDNTSSKTNTVPEKLTEEEHHARAMLMGMHYFKAFNYYGKHNKEPRFDADTLEEIDMNEIMERHKAYNEQAPYTRRT